MIGSTVFYNKKKEPLTPKLNLVALMDIFTILVFFLLLNTGESQKIENAKFIDLPDSTAGTTPHNQLLIMIDEDYVWLGNDRVGEISVIMQNPQMPIEALAQALSANKEAIPELTPYEQANGLPVTILGDKSVSYTLLKTVMATCQGSGYREISLAVNQIIATPGDVDLAKSLTAGTFAKVGG